MDEDFANAAKHRFRTVSNLAVSASASAGAYRMVLKKASLPHGETYVLAKPKAVTIALDLASAKPTARAFMGPIRFYDYGQASACGW